MFGKILNCKKYKTSKIIVFLSRSRIFFAAPAHDFFLERLRVFFFKRLLLQGAKNTRLRFLSTGCSSQSLNWLAEVLYIGVFSIATKHQLLLLKRLYSYNKSSKTTKDMKKFLKENCLTRTYKKISHMT